jgi:hypothetical protein
VTPRTKRRLIAVLPILGACVLSVGLSQLWAALFDSYGVALAVSILGGQLVGGLAGCWTVLLWMDA